MTDPAMTASELIAEARRLDAAATLPPWTIRCEDSTSEGIDAADGIDVVYAHGAEIACFPTSPDRDAAFIVAARELLPRLADELEATRAQLISAQGTNDALARRNLTLDGYREQAEAAILDLERGRDLRAKLETDLAASMARTAEVLDQLRAEREARAES